MIQLGKLFSPVSSLDPDGAREFIAAHPEGTYTLLDVRQPEEYAKEHIPGAKLIPLPALRGQKHGDAHQRSALQDSGGGKGSPELIKPTYGPKSLKRRNKRLGGYHEPRAIRFFPFNKCIEQVLADVRGAHCGCQARSLHDRYLWRDRGSKQEDAPSLSLSPQSGWKAAQGFLYRGVWTTRYVR